MQIIGIEIDPPFIHLARAERRKKKVRILKLQTFDFQDLSEQANVKQLYILEKERLPLVSGLPAKDLLLRRFFLKTTKRKIALKTLPFHLESQTFLDLDKIISLPFFELSKEGCEVSSFSTTKTLLEGQLNLCKSHSFDPERISSIPMALARFLQRSAPEQTTSLIFHIGSSSSTAVFVEKGQLKAFHGIPLGLDHLLASLKKDKKTGEKEENIDLLALPDLGLTHFKKEVSALKKEAAKAFFSLVETENIPPKKIPLLITGQGRKLLHLEEFLALGFAESFSHFLPEEKEFPDLKQHAVSLGFALDGLAKDGRSLQFRQKEFIPLKHLRKLAASFLLLFLISTSFALALHRYTQKESAKKNSSLASLLDLAIKKDSDLLHRPFPPAASESFETRLLSWEKMLVKEGKPIPYLLKAPSVADALAWLSSHPILNSGEEIDLITFEYELVKYPKIDAWQEPSLAKVHLEFQIPSHTLARKLHEALLKGDHFVNPSQEIVWEAKENSYKTSFYLNPLSTYDKKAS